MCIRDRRDGPNLTSPNLLAIVDNIRPSIDAEQSLDDAIAANVVGTVKKLQQESLVLNDLAARGELTIVGAEYSIETGAVTYLD